MLRVYVDFWGRVFSIKRIVGVKVLMWVCLSCWRNSNEVDVVGVERISGEV